MGKIAILVAGKSDSRRGELREKLVALAKDSASVVEARDGTELCSRASLQQFSLVVLDELLAKRDGFSALRALEALPPELRPRAAFVFLENGAGALAAEEVHAIELELGAPGAKVDALDAWFRRKAAPGSATPPAFDAKLVNAFIESTIAVLQTTASLKSSKEKIFLREKSAPSGDVSGFMPIVAASARGSMSVSFEAPCFLAVANRMLGEEHKEISPEIADAAAELCNQIFGMAKKALNECGYQIQPALPTVIQGARHSVQHDSKGPCVVVRFATEAGYFSVEASLEKLSA
jgi:chemotaxis protein CheX